jgi:hypothetical protein
MSNVKYSTTTLAAAVLRELFQPVLDENMENVFLPERFL